MLKNKNSESTDLDIQKITLQHIEFNFFLSKYKAPLINFSFKLQQYPENRLNDGLEFWIKHFLFNGDKNQKEILEKILSYKLTYLTSLMYLVLPDEISLKIIRDFVHYIFLHDNIVDDETIAHAEILRINDIHNQAWKGLIPKSNDTPYLNTIYDLRSRLLNSVNDITSFLEKIEKYFISTSLIKEEKANAGQNSLSEQRVVENHRATGGVALVFELTFALSKCSLVDITDKKIADILEKISNEAELIILLSNDIASYQKEKKQGLQSTYDNLLLYREIHCNQCVDDAYSYVIALINLHIRTLVELKMELSKLTSDRAALKRVAVMENWIAANLLWSKMSLRYNEKIIASPDRSAFQPRTSIWRNPLTLAGVAAIAGAIFASNASVDYFNKLSNTFSQHQ